MFFKILYSTVWKVSLSSIVIGVVISAAPIKAVSAETSALASRSQHVAFAGGEIEGEGRQVVTFSKLGVSSSLPLRGLGSSQTVSFGVRKDEVVVGAKLKLKFTYSPSLIYPLSHIKIIFNDEVVDTIELDKKNAGSMVTREVNLDPRFFVDFNRIELQLIAHYAVDNCEDTAHSSLWADISPTSELVLTKSQLALPDDLSILPVPFFDRRDNGKVVLPFILPSKVSLSTLQAAGAVSSWIGALADYREFSFPVVDRAPIASHAVAFVTPTDMLEGIKLPSIRGPGLAVITNPTDHLHKLLLVMGRNARELQTAANALVMGQAALSGAVNQVEAIDIGEPRKPYDAPRWIPVNRPVKFGELVTDLANLQVSGNTPAPIRVGLRVPADLYGWNDRAVPLNFNYRYTSPSNYNDSVLNVDINGQLVKSDRLKPSNMQNSETLVGVPLLSGNDAAISSKVNIPALRVGSNNQMQFRFHIDSEQASNCKSSAGDVIRAAVDPDSSIDFSGFYHYAAMPNLAFFANSGYPFTRLADLADTAVVMSDTPSPLEAETLLGLLGHMGKWTGMPALRVKVAGARELESVKDKNLLIISTGSASRILKYWSNFLPVIFESTYKKLRLRDQQPLSLFDRWIARGSDVQKNAGEVVFGGGAAITALVGFESPLREGRSVVAMVAPDPDHLAEVLEVLENSDAVARIHGDVAIIRHRDVESLSLGNHYFIGDLPWYAKLWVRMSGHPILMAFLGVFAGAILALGAFIGLRRLAALRIGE